MQFFIDRPIFAMVLSIVVVLVGALALPFLPIAQYPEVAPPTIEVTAVYPGASARDVAAQVATPVEQEINGVENLLYMESKCTNDGQMKLTVTFQLGTDLNMAQVLVQNRVNLATPKLPDAVKQTGVTVKKKSPSIVLCVNFIDPTSDDPGRQLYLSNYAALQVKDQLARLPGVGDVTFLGEREYSMRLWLDPDQMARLSLTPGDVIRAIREQNTQVPAGQVGQPPTPGGQNFQLPIATRGRLTTPDQFANIILKSGKQGEVVRVRDVVRQPREGADAPGVELSAKNFDVGSTLSGKPTVTLAVYQLPGSNALKTAEAVHAKMDELSKQFPKGVAFKIEYDTTGFVKTSIETVVHTLFEAIALVFIVVLVFLQTWRASLVPLIAVPVSLIGTFGVMLAIGFSLNNLTLFGLVLAIGIVVDDAIVVVEAVEHHMAHGLPPKEATRKAMREVAGPVIAMTLVLCAVFIPCAFITGITGQFFRQFALTIVVSTLISAFNSLTLSPALCPLLLRPKGAKRDPLTWLFDLTLGWFFTGFNWAFDRATAGYVRSVGWLVHGRVAVLAAFVGLLFLTWYGFVSVPAGFIPQQDKGYLIVGVTLPDGASLERTQRIVKDVDEMARQTDGVQSTIAMQGMSVLTNANGANLGSMFVILKPFEERERHHGQSGPEVLADLMRKFRAVRGAQVVAFGPPPVDGLGTSGGFKMQVEARSAVPLQTLQAAADDLAREANADPDLAGVYNSFRANTPQVSVTVNETKAKAMHVPLAAVNEALQVYLGSYYVNDVTLFNRNYQVILQADPTYRLRPDDVKRLQVRNDEGDMVPLGTLVDVKYDAGPAIVFRYNTYPSAAVGGATRPGVSSGDGVAAMEGVARQQLPPGVGYEWTELTLLQIQAGNVALVVFALAVVLVFLVLAAQYESWSLPLAVILVVPMCLLCSVIGVVLAGEDVNIFTQIGLVVLVGLASKNAILIVEFAKAEREGGKSAYDAVREACRLRLRPILMTSFAFILGVVPLVLAHGAGAEMRRTLGVAVFSGMLGVTVFGVFLTPVFYYVIDRLGGRKPAAPAPTASLPATDGIASAPAAATAIQAGGDSSH